MFKTEVEPPKGWRKVTLQALIPSYNWRLTDLLFVVGLIQDKLQAAMRECIPILSVDT